MRMNDYVIKASLEEVIHSSGYAKSQSGGNIGSTGRSRFRKQNHNTIIQDYSQSKLAQIRHSSFENVNKKINSNLEQIRLKRAECKDSTGNFENSELLSRNNLKNSTHRDARNLRKSNFNNIQTSGLARGKAIQKTSSSSNLNSGFHQIRPQIGK